MLVGLHEGGRRIRLTNCQTLVRYWATEEAALLKVGLEKVFTIKVRFGDRIPMQTTSRGWKRGYVGVKGGEISGRLTGIVIPDTGGDYPYIHEDGSAIFEAQYVLEASDGARIVLKNRGFRHGPKEVLDAILAGQEIDPNSVYFRIAPTFDAPVGPHDWLNRTVFVGTGNRKRDHSIFTYYAVT